MASGTPAASLLVASEANVKAVQRMLGHASAAMTLNVYSGLFDDDLGSLAERMDAAHDAHISGRRVGAVWARDKISELERAPLGADQRRWWWGGWGSNPRPRDYEHSRPQRCADQQKRR